jgi:para-aminobenzoate synthetase component 1
MSSFKIQIQVDKIKNQLLNYGEKFDTFFFYDSNVETNKNNAYSYSSYDIIAAVGCKKKVIFDDKNSFNSIQDFQQKNNTWLFGYLGYDLKNEIEHLTSTNDDFLNLPIVQFIEPEIVITVIGNELNIISLASSFITKNVADDILAHSDFINNFDAVIPLETLVKKEAYIDTINKLKQQIGIGNIYEINYCIPFQASYKILQGISLFKQLNDLSKAPFSAYAKVNNAEIICASPERFLKKEGNKLISQPIKGTSKRGQNIKADEALKLQLKQSQKEQSENVMIVDLVRNDLSKSALRNSVKVEELFGVYSFAQVHQMISTITSTLRDNISFTDAIKNAFPMGSMTGAPKIKAMQLIEQFELMKRNIYSGALGYITPENNFDFNVIIRSIIVNTEQKKLQICVGGAITAAANAEQEYEECLLKANALFKVLQFSCY